jgi:hypothetical protein
MREEGGTKKKNKLTSQVIWDPSSTGLVFVGWDSRPRRLGIIYCANRPSSIFFVPFAAPGKFSEEKICAEDFLFLMKANSNFFKRKKRNPTTKEPKKSPSWIKQVIFSENEIFESEVFIDLSKKTCTRKFAALLNQINFFQCL